MPQQDHLHNSVKKALQRDGWKITGEQVYLVAGLRGVWIDLQAEYVNEDNFKQVVLIEIKSFADKNSIMNQVHVAVGQYSVYRIILEKLQIETDLYLAISQAAYAIIWSEPPGTWSAERLGIKLLIIDEFTESIVQWIP